MFGDFSFLSLLNIWKKLIIQDGLLWHVSKATSEAMSVTFTFISKTSLAYSSSFFFGNLSIETAIRPGYILGTHRIQASNFSLPKAN